MNRSGFTIGLVGWLACAPAAQAPSSEATAPPASSALPASSAALASSAAPASSALPASSAAPASALSLSAVEREHLALIDPLRWYFVQRQPTPSPLGVLARRGPFPGVAFASVTGVAIATDWGALRTVASCDHGPGSVFSKDGRYCSHVVHPAIALSVDQQRRLLRFLHGVDESPRPRIRCDFAGTHAFIFRDATERAVASVAAELTGECSGQWYWWPSTPWSGYLMAPHEKAFFTRLCRELHLPGCSDAYPRFAKSDAARALEPHERDPLGGVPPDATLDTLSLEQKKRLCARYAGRMVAIMRSPHGAPKMGMPIECALKGRETRFLTVSECVEEFPKCNRPVAEVTTCWDTLVTPFRVVPPICAPSLSVVDAACGPKLECAVGVARCSRQQVGKPSSSLRDCTPAWQ